MIDIANVMPTAFFIARPPPARPASFVRAFGPLFCLKVSCLRASLSFQVPVVLAGTAEGTVFAFHLQEDESSTSSTSTSEREGESSFNGDGGGGGNAGEGRETGSAQVSRADGTVGKTELGVVLMKFEHTRQSIQGVCCSQEQVHVVLYDMI